MAILSKQKIPNDVKETLESMAEKSGNSIASIVRGMLQKAVEQAKAEVA